MRVDLETKEKKEMYRSTGQIIRMDISPDGNWLAFLEGADSTLKVMPIEVKGMGDLCLHPDGRRIAFSDWKVDYPTYIMENFLPKEK